MSKYIEWKRRKNLFTNAQTAILLAFIWTFNVHSQIVSDNNTYLAFVYILVINRMIIGYRKWQHEPFVRQNISTRRNQDYSLEAWEFNYPQKVWEAAKLLNIHNKTPVFVLIAVIFVLSPAFILWKLEAIKIVEQSVDYVLVLPDPDINFVRNTEKVPLSALINEPSIFWMWDDRTVFEYQNLVLTAENNPGINFYFIRSYGNSLTFFDDIQLPENITVLDPYGFNLVDSQVVTNSNFTSVIFDTEQNIVDGTTITDTAALQELISRNFLFEE